MSNPGRDLSLMRKPRLVRCAQCGKSFSAVDSRAKFCSNACKMADRYARTKTKKVKP
jgi:endogenous inhibitor of DNA gyrase (YacG/DUF329 family)